MSRSRMEGCDRSARHTAPDQRRALTRPASRRSETAWCRRRRNSCSNRSSRRTSSIARGGSARTARRTTRWPRCGATSSPGARKRTTPTCPHTSIAFPTTSSVTTAPQLRRSAVQVIRGPTGSRRLILKRSREAAKREYQRASACASRIVRSSSCFGCGLRLQWWNPPTAMREPKVNRPKSGTPPEGQVRRCSGRTWQGGVISPLLANLYLHWFDVKFHRLEGPYRWANARRGAVRGRPCHTGAVRRAADRSFR